MIATFQEWFPRFRTPAFYLKHYLRRREQLNKEFAWATIRNPSVEMDFAGACLTQSSLNMLIELMSNVPGRENIDIHLRRVSINAIPRLTASFSDNKGDNS